MFVVLCAPGFSSAQTLAELHANIQALLAQLDALKAQGIEQIPSSSQSIPPSAVACTLDAKLCPDGSWVGREGPQCQFAACPGEVVKKTPKCISLVNNLRTGSTDATTSGEVSILQSYLAEDSSIYPEGLVTGYFGPATERAVQRWQGAHGVLSSGSPETNGFGSVGPLTRFALKNVCSSVSAVPLFPTAILPTQTTPAASYFAAIDASSLSAISTTPTITGTAGGLSAVKLVAKRGQTVVLESGEIPVVDGAWRIYISTPLTPGAYTFDITSPAGARLATGGFSISGPQSGTLFSATPLSGVVPFPVTFTLLTARPFSTYTIEFGDGQSAQIRDTVTHTYTIGRAFTARLVRTGTSCETCQDYTTEVVGTINIVGRDKVTL